MENTLEGEIKTIKKHFHKFFLCLIVSICLAPFTLRAGESVNGDNEPPTQRNGMHSCPLNGQQLTYVTGVNVNKGYLLCTDSLGYGQTFPLSAEIVDGDNEPPNQREGMHACPPKHAVTGIHANKNLLACAPYYDMKNVDKGEMPRVDAPDESALPFWCRYWPGAPGCWRDPGNQREGMHACKTDEVLIGIHVGRNRFLCGKVTDTIHVP